MDLLSAAVLLFLVMDPVGNVPLFVALLQGTSGRERAWVVLREHLFALAVLMAFLFGGRSLLRVFQIDEPALSIAGGILLFLIALRMIFPKKEGLFGASPEGIPFIVPLAMPLIAGPSTLTTVLLMMSREPENWPTWLLALLIAWTASLAILLLATRLATWLGQQTLAAFERLMGMLLTAIAVQMFLTGVAAFLKVQQAGATAVR